MTEKTTQLSLEGNVKVFVTRSLLKGTYNSIHRIIYQPFILSLNPSMTMLGLLEGIGGYQGFLPALARPFFGWLSDRVKRKPFIVLGSLLTAISVILFLISGITKIFFFVIPAIILMGVSSFDRPIVDSLIAESVEPAKRGIVYSRITLAMMAPGIFSPFIGGMIADRFGFLKVFAIGLIIQCVIVIFLIRYLRENPLPRRAISFSEFYLLVKRNISPPRTLRSIYLLNMFDAVVSGLGPVLVVGILRVHFNFSNFQLGVIAIIRSVVTTVTQIFIGKIIRKYGCKNVLIISYLSWVLYIGGIVLSKSFWSILLIQIFMGIAFATWRTPHQTLMANSTTPIERAEAMGRISFYRGIFGFFAPFLGGFLYEQYGYSTPLWVSFVLGVIVVFFIHLYVHVKDDKLI